MFENQKEAPTRAVYEEVASGDIALTIAALHTDENGLRAERATLEQQEARDQATTNQEATLGQRRRARPRSSSRPSSQRSRASSPWRWPSSRRHRPRLLQQQSGRHRPRLLLQWPLRAASGPPSTTSTALQGSAASTSSSDPSLPPFLQCVLQAESGGNYDAVSPGGTYMGGFQFSQATWNEAAELAGMPQLINVPPNEATPAEQDDLAIALYDADGEQSWNDSCRTS